MDTIINQIEAIGVVPVIAIAGADKAVPLARALADGGLPCAEITFRTEAGAESLRRIAAEAPDILLGAGTILSVGQAEIAVRAGAKFIVSPGLNPKVVAYCVERGVPVIPGCVTPTEMEAGMEMGLRAVKFFPAEQAGGLAYIKAVSAPYPLLRFMPTGGVTPENLGKYLAFPKVFACGGSWMARGELIGAGRFDEITRLCREAALIVKEARGNSR